MMYFVGQYWADERFLANKFSCPRQSLLWQLAFLCLLYQVFQRTPEVGAMYSIYPPGPGPKGDQLSEQGPLEPRD